MARRRTKSREIDPANRSAKHPCKTAIQLLPHGSTKRSIKRAIPHNATGNSGMTGNTDIPRCCPFGSGSRASVSRVWRVAARAHRTHTTVIHSSNRTERISASPFRRTVAMSRSRHWILHSAERYRDSAPLLGSPRWGRAIRQEVSHIGRGHRSNTKRTCRLRRRRELDRQRQRELTRPYRTS